MSSPSVKDIFSPLFIDSSGRYKNEIGRDVIEKIIQHKLFKCFLPADVGGLDMNILEMLRVIEDCSYVNGSLGWLIQIGNGGNYFAEYFDEKTYRKLFSPKDAVIAGSGAPSGKVIATNGGFKLSGEWRYASGSDYATIFTTSFIDTDGTTVRSCALMRDQVEIINDWKTSGLKNSSTNSFRVKDAFVPQEQIFVLTERKQTLPSDAFRFPFLSFAQLF
ncbi:MAG TPA: acyl-CoA dehydrogenase family protein, partial [Bacteroidia bacterium]|nr:acyl-CoA dehydrogenase family protein [Bacteroidia bacterium]